MTRLAPKQEVDQRKPILGKTRQRNENAAFVTSRARVLDPELAKQLIQDRQSRGIDLYDEVWEGVYVMPPMPNLRHQRIVRRVSTVFDGTLVEEGLAEVYPGANVSDRRTNWQTNYRVPDVVVVLKNSQAIDCGTHLFGGPDFLVEIQSPGDDTEEKLLFYRDLRVREVLVIHRDQKHLRLFRHDGNQLVLVQATTFRGKKWLVSEVIPFAFRRVSAKSGARVEIQRTDGKPGSWTV